MYTPILLEPGVFAEELCTWPHCGFLLKALFQKVLKVKGTSIRDRGYRIFNDPEHH